MHNARTRHSYRWFVMVGVIAAMLAYGLIIFSMASLLPVIEEDLGLSHAQSGTLVGLFSLATIFLAVPSGRMVDHFGHYFWGCVSLLLLAAGTVLIALGDSYWAVALGRVISGIGGALLVVVGPRSISLLFDRSEMGFAMGVYHTGVPLGKVAALALIPLVAQLFDWRAAIWVACAVSVVAFLLFALLLFPTRRNESHQSQNRSRLGDMGGEIWWLGLSVGLFSAGATQFYTYAPKFYVSQGQTLAMAGVSSSYAIGTALLLCPFVGLLIDRCRGKKALLLFSCCLTSLALLLIPNLSNYSILSVVILGAISNIAFSVLYIIPTLLLPGSRLGTGFGILMSMMAAGHLGGSYVIGVLLDQWSSYPMAFAFMALLTFLTPLPLMRLDIGTSISR